MKSELTNYKSETSNNSEDTLQAEFFRKMSVKNLEQCGTLAEQLICLRSDLDRSNLNVLKMQRIRCNSISPSAETVFSPKPQEPPHPIKMDWNSVVHSRKDSNFPDSRLNQSQQEINQSFTLSRRREIVAGQYKIGSISRMMPPRAPLVAKYNSNNKSASLNRSVHN